MARQGTLRRLAEVLLIAGVADLSAPAAAPAQLATTFGLEERQGALARVPVGKIIRLRLTDGGRVAGPILRWTAISVTVGPYLGYAERDTFAAVQAVDTLWVRGAATRRGALTGGAAGLAAGIVFGTSAGSLCPTSARTPKPCAQGAVTSSVAGLVIGGLVGALVGSATPQWKRLHPRDGAGLPAVPSGPQVVLEAPGESDAPDPRALALARTRANALVRVRFAAGPDLAGYVVRAGARRAVIAPVAGGNAGAGPIALGSIEGIWERGTAARSGSVVGSLVGVGAGVIIAVKSCDASNDCAASLVADGVLGGLMGWVLGAGVASRFPKWHRRF